jgi:hypothetical protein
MGASIFFTAAVIRAFRYFVRQQVEEQMSRRQLETLPYKHKHAPFCNKEYMF